MPLDLPPSPELWRPQRPAIVRASELPRSYAEAKRIAYKSQFLPGVGAAAGFLSPRAGSIAIAGTIGETIVTNNATHALNMPASITAGELLVCCGMIDRQRTISSGFTGWTQLYYDSTDPGLGFWYKTAAGGETLSIAFSAACYASWTVMRIINFDPLAAPEANSAATGSSTAPNSGSISPSWGSASAMFLSLVALFNTNSPATISAAPPNYNGPYPNSGSGSMAYRVAVASAEDPAAFTTSSSYSWRARTVAIKSSV